MIEDRSPVYRSCSFLINKKVVLRGGFFNVKPVGVFDWVFG